MALFICFLALPYTFVKFICNFICNFTNKKYLCKKFNRF